MAVLGTIIICHVQSIKSCFVGPETSSCFAALHSIPANIPGTFHFSACRANAADAAIGEIKIQRQGNEVPRK